MAQATTAAMPNMLSASHDRSGLGLGTAVTELRRLLNGFFDPYRPEQHYMRGPGPKWREKHGSRTSS